MYANSSPQIRGGLGLQYSLDAWRLGGTSKEAFPLLFALIENPSCTVGDCWDGTWNPTFHDSVSDQRIAELLCM